MCIHVLMFICTCTSRGTCICTHVHEDVCWCQLSSSRALHLRFWEKVPQWTWDSRWLARPASQWTAKICIYITHPSTGATEESAQCLLWVLEIWTQVLMLIWKEFYQTSPPPSPTAASLNHFLHQNKLAPFRHSPFLGGAQIPYWISVHQWDVRSRILPVASSLRKQGLQVRP